MILTFAQGIVRHATTTGDPGDTQNFLSSPSSNRVDLNASREQPLMLSMVERDGYYLITIMEDSGTIQAWGYGTANSNNAPMVIGQGSGLNSDQFYLYVDVNKKTGEVSYGYSKYGLTSGTTPPFPTSAQNRPDDVHWFNTANKTMSVWRATGNAPSYGSFASVVRVFIAKYTIGSGTFVSLSNDAPSFLGTQVGLTGSFRTGALVFDPNGNVFKRSSSSGANVFFTSEDLITTQLPTSSRVRIESFVVDGLAETNLAAYDLVRFNDFNKITSLTPSLQSSGLFGIIEEGVVTGQLTKVTIDGVVSNPSWNWEEINQQLFCGTGGELTTSAVLPNQAPVAYVLSPTSIVLRPSRVDLTSTAAGDVDPATTGELGVVKISYPTTGSPFLPDPIVVSLNDPILNPGNIFASQTLFQAHYTETTTHFTQAEIDHTAISNIGTNTHAQIDSHIADSSIHFTEGSIDHTAISNIGTNTHAQIDSHIADSSIHFTIGSVNLEDLANTSGGSPSASTGDVLTWDGSQWEPQIPSSGGSFDVGSPIGSAISHLNLQDIGSYTHAQIDSHINDTANPHSLILPYDLVAQAFDPLGTSVPLRIMQMVAVRDFRILGGSPESHYGYCVTSPTGSNTTFTVYVNDVSIGSVTFTIIGSPNTSQTVTFSLTETDLSEGDVIDVRMTTADSNDEISDVTISLQGIVLS